MGEQRAGAAGPLSGACIDDNPLIAFLFSYLSFFFRVFFPKLLWFSLRARAIERIKRNTFRTEKKVDEASVFCLKRVSMKIIRCFSSLRVYIETSYFSLFFVSTTTLIIGLFGRRRFTPDPFDRLFGDDDALMTSSFLDSMIPREHISDMNQFDFVCDIVEKKDRYTLSGELPGCNVKNVDIKMDKDNNLHVSAHKSTKHEEEDQSRDGRMKWHAIERSSGRVERIFTLPEGADPEKVEASMKDGILTIDVKKKPEAIGEPKVEEEGMKTIPIKAQ